VDTLAHGYGLAEAPRWVPPDNDLADHPDGVLLFSDVLGGGIHRWSPESGIATIVPKRRGVGGMALHADGGVVVTGRDLQHVVDSETRQLLALEGATGFNDMTTDRDGAIYVGALRFNPFAGEQPVPGDVWRVDGTGSAKKLFGEVEWPNGIAFSPDGDTIYTCDYAAERVLAHDLNANGEAENRRVFAKPESGSVDGLAVDVEGGVWVALASAGGIGRYSPDGSLDEILDVPAGFVTSLCFGGADGRDLFITTMDNSESAERRGTVFAAQAPVAGLPRPLATI
jgi:sugar lactone lactonase YvrE